MASAMLAPCETSTSTCRSFATISSGLYLFLGISVLLDAKRHTSSRTTSMGGAHDDPPHHLDLHVNRGLRGCCHLSRRAASGADRACRRRRVADLHHDGIARG